METTTLASVLEQDLAGVTDAACARIRRCVPHAQDDPAAEHLESSVRTGLDAFSRAWARQRPLADEELAEATRWCDRSGDGLPREVLLHAYRVVVDVVRDHIERRVEELGPRLTEPSEVMSLLGQLGLARSLERQLTDAVEAATTVRERVQAADRLRLEADVVAALLDVPTDITAAHGLLRELGLSVAGPWTVAAIPAARRAPRVRALLSGNGLERTVVADRPEGVVVLAGDTPAAVAAALAGEETAGIGGRADALSGVRRSAEEAASALEISIGRGLGPVRADRADLDLLLIGAVTPAELVERTLAPLARLEASRRDWMLETLEAYLDAGTSVTAAARALCLHRESARYRITKLRDLFGSDLDDPDRRLALHLAVKALRHGLSPAAAGGDVAAART